MLDHDFLVKRLVLIKSGFNMKPYTNDTFGRNYSFSGPKESRVPKSAKDRAGTKAGSRRLSKVIIASEVDAI